MSDVFVKNIYYLGPEGSNSYIAAFRAASLCKINTENFIPCQSIRHALENVEQDNNSFAVLPCENSIEGIVRETVDNMLNFSKDGVNIKGEIVLPVEHCLLSHESDRTKINLIISHPQALAQCREYLYKNFPDVMQQSVSSTSYAAQKAARDGNGIAAIANEACSQIYNLNIIDKSINDEKGNKTRFFIIGREKPEKGLTGKTALMISTKNKPGALCNVLKVFEKYNINLTCIDSRPSKKKLGEYLFFVELDELENEADFASAMSELKLYTDFVRILGSYYSYNR